MSLDSVKSGTVELVVFAVSDIVCGLAIDDIQEIIRVRETTRVNGAPEFVRGVINLRGQIVTIIDLRKKFGIDSREISSEMRIIVVQYQDEFLGLLIDEVRDSIHAEEEAMSAPPGNISGVQGEFFNSIYKMKGDLVAIINLEKILQKDD